MNARILFFFAAATCACACGSPRSTFDFTMTGDVGRVSDRDATGLVDDTGVLAIDDAAWHLGMTLGGLYEGSHANVAITIIDKSNARIFSTDQGGSCTVFVDPHDTTNGSSISGHFSCTALADGTGNVVDVNGVEFLTYISDAANNPTTSPPHP
jgi:hypothetical protein